MRLLPEQRRSMVDAVRRGFTKALVAEVHNVSRKTVTQWCKRAKHRGSESLKDKNPVKRIKDNVKRGIIHYCLTYNLRLGHRENPAGQGLIALSGYVRGVLPSTLRSRLELVKNEHQRSAQARWSQGL